MWNLVIHIGQLALGFAYILAPVIAVLLFLKYRDRKATQLNTLVLKELNVHELRGLYTVQLKSGIFAGDSVIIDLWGCSRERMWEVVSRLSAHLPPNVRLVLNGISDPGSRSALTLKIERRTLVCPAPCMP
jgi:hypothetical protein